MAAKLCVDIIIAYFPQKRNFAAAYQFAAIHRFFKNGLSGHKSAIISGSVSGKLDFYGTKCRTVRKTFVLLPSFAS